MVKNLLSNAGDIRDVSSIPGSERSPGGDPHNNPLQYSCLENFMDRKPGGLQSTGSQSLAQLVKRLYTHEGRDYSASVFEYLPGLASSPIEEIMRS